MDVVHEVRRRPPGGDPTVGLDHRQPTYLSKGASLSRVQHALVEHIREGDIIFLDSNNFLHKRVAEATGSHTSHAAIIFRNGDGEWMVYESTFPRSKKTPLTRYLRKTIGARFCVCRLQSPLSAQDLDTLRQSAERRLGRLYGFGFDLDSAFLFGAKFVYQVFAEALSIELGQVQTFRQIREQNRDFSLLFWRLWFLGRIPWGRRTVTPRSQSKDPQLHTVFESH